MRDVCLAQAQEAFWQKAVMGTFQHFRLSVQHSRMRSSHAKMTFRSAQKWNYRQTGRKSVRVLRSGSDGSDGGERES